MIGQLLQVLEIIAPVFMLAFAGYVWGRLRLNFDLEFVTRLAVNFSMPCLIFAVLVKVEIEPGAVRDIALAALAAYAALGLALWLGLRAAGWSVRAYLVPGTFGNTGNIGLPVALYAYGEPGLAFAIVIFAVMTILQFTVGIYVVAGTGRVLDVLRQPLVYASVLGGVFAFEGWEVPGWALDSLDLAGQIAIPAMLLTLGVSIANLSVGEVGRAALFSLLKLAAAAAIALAVAEAFGLTGAAHGTLVLQIIMPVGVTTYLLAERYRAQPESIAGAVVISTLVAVLAVPAALAMLL